MTERLLWKRTVPAPVPLADITRADVQRWFASCRATPVAADRSMPVLSVTMKEAERMGYRPEGSNPCRGIRRYRRKGRERFLSDAEIGRPAARRERARHRPAARTRQPAHHAQVHPPRRRDGARGGRDRRRGARGGLTDDRHRTHAPRGPSGSWRSDEKGQDDAQGGDAGDPCLGRAGTWILIGSRRTSPLTPHTVRPGMQVDEALISITASADQPGWRRRTHAAARCRTLPQGGE